MTKAIFFDFDGTLADTAPGIVVTMKETFRELKLEAPSDEAIRQTIGLPLLEGIKILTGFDGPDADNAAALYRSLFPRCELTHISVFPNVVKTLEMLFGKGIRMAVCTSRGSDSLDSIMERHSLNKYFETRTTASDNLPPKPDPGMVLALLERIELDPRDVIVVGDTTFDIRMGQGAKCRTCAVTYGNHSRQQLLAVSPTYIIDDFSQLPGIILQ